MFLPAYVLLTMLFMQCSLIIPFVDMHICTQHRFSLLLSNYMYIRGLQFYTFFGISIGITRRLIDIGKK
jgi:hypothetical protein